jgi:hypothetical protein
MSNSSISNIKHNPVPPRSTRSKSDDDPLHLPKIDNTTSEKKRELESSSKLREGGLLQNTLKKEEIKLSPGIKYSEKGLDNIKNRVRDLATNSRPATKKSQLEESAPMPKKSLYSEENSTSKSNNIKSFSKDQHKVAMGKSAIQEGIFGKDILLATPEKSNLFDDIFDDMDEISYVRVTINEDSDTDDLNDLKELLNKGYSVIGQDAKAVTDKIKSANTPQDILPKETNGPKSANSSQGAQKTQQKSTAQQATKTEASEQITNPDSQKKSSSIFKKILFGFVATLIGGGAGALGVMSLLGMVALSGIASSVALGIPFLIILGVGLYFAFRPSREDQEPSSEQQHLDNEGNIS